MRHPDETIDFAVTVSRGFQQGLEVIDCGECTPTQIKFIMGNLLPEETLQVRTASGIYGYFRSFSKWVWAKAQGTAGHELGDAILWHIIKRMPT